MSARMVRGSPGIIGTQLDLIPRSELEQMLMDEAIETKRKQVLYFVRKRARLNDLGGSYA